MVVVLGALRKLLEADRIIRPLPSFLQLLLRRAPKRSLAGGAKMAEVMIYAQAALMNGRRTKTQNFAFVHPFDKSTKLSVN